jgi:hypothetical protein
VPLPYQGPEASDIETHLDGGEDAPEAELEVAYTRVVMLDSAQKKNAWKARLLILALAFEVAAIACVGIAVFEVASPGAVYRSGAKKSTTPPVIGGAAVPCQITIRWAERPDGDRNNGDEWVTFAVPGARCRSR